MSKLCLAVAVVLLVCGSARSAAAQGGVCPDCENSQFLSVVRPQPQICNGVVYGVYQYIGPANFNGTSVLSMLDSALAQWNITAAPSGQTVNNTVMQLIEASQIPAGCNNLSPTHTIDATKSCSATQNPATGTEYVPYACTTGSVTSIKNLFAHTIFDPATNKPVNPIISALDFQGTLAHEIGHTLGENGNKSCNSPSSPPSVIGGADNLGRRSDGCSKNGQGCPPGSGAAPGTEGGVLLGADAVQPIDVQTVLFAFQNSANNGNLPPAQQQCTGTEKTKTDYPPEEGGGSGTPPTDPGGNPINTGFSGGFCGAGALTVSECTDLCNMRGSDPSYDWTDDCGNSAAAICFDTWGGPPNLQCSVNGSFSARVSATGRIGVYVPPGTAVSFQSSSGNYISAPNGGGSSVDVVPTQVGLWETFTIVDLSGSQVMTDRDSVAIQSEDGLYLQASSAGVLTADTFSTSGQATFTIVDLDTPGNGIVSGDHVALVDSYGSFVSAQNGGGGAIEVNRTAVGPWETFVFVAPASSGSSGNGSGGGSSACPGTSNTLCPNQQLAPKGAFGSPGGVYFLTYQTDGNLVEYNTAGFQAGGGAVWASNTAGTTPGWVAMQGDGNFVVYNQSGTPLWASNTAGNPGGYLALQDNGNLAVIGSSGQVLWTNGVTGGGAPPSGGGGGGSAPCPGTSNTLCGGQQLGQGGAFGSPSGIYFLAMQSSGDLEEFNTAQFQAGGGPAWTSNTASSNPGWTSMGSDGNLVVYDGSGNLLWQSGTGGNPGAYLVIQDDGSLYVSDINGNRIWSAGG